MFKGEYVLEYSYSSLNSEAEFKKAISYFKLKYKIDIFEFSQSYENKSGDLWGIFALSADSFAFYILDFCGHGEKAYKNVKNIHKLMLARSDLALDPLSYINYLNIELCDSLEPGLYATMFYSVINIKENNLTYVTCANPAPILLKNNKASKVSGGKGLPLGIDKEGHFTQMKKEFAPNSALFIYSDGLLETKDKNSQYLNEEDLVAFFNKSLSGANHNNIPLAFNVLVKDFKTNYLLNLQDDLSLILMIRS